LEEEERLPIRATHNLQSSCPLIRNLSGYPSTHSCLFASVKHWACYPITRYQAQLEEEERYFDLSSWTRLFLSRVFNRRLAKTRLGGGGKISLSWFRKY